VLLRELLHTVEKTPEHVDRVLTEVLFHHCRGSKAVAFGLEPLLVLQQDGLQALPQREESRIACR
jgi:hypothetical protein